MTEDGRGPSNLPSNDSLLRAVAVAPPRSVGPLEDPKQIANFRIVARLGSGGMGVVYRAEDESLRRHVALKLPHASHTNDPERRRRFLREARAAAALTHPNVAAVYQVGETETWVYLAMEFVDGTTLREQLKDGPLPGPAARALALQMARGLAAAHAKGIVHRDFKPENIMVTTAGVVKVLDFGLAKGGSAIESDSALGNAETETQITRDGTLLGTSAYMSPEQALGMAVDPRSDVFAFGIVLFEMLAGRRPFEGRTAGELRAAITRDQPASDLRARSRSRTWVSGTWSRGVSPKHRPNGSPTHKPSPRRSSRETSTSSREARRRAECHIAPGGCSRRSWGPRSRRRSCSCRAGGGRTRSYPLRSRDSRPLPAGSARRTTSARAVTEPVPGIATSDATPASRFRRSTAG